MKRQFLLTALVMMCSILWAQGPNGSGTYYKNANGKSGKSLKTALANIIVNPKNVGYDGLYEAYKKTDTRADGFVRDWYSNTTKYKHCIDNKGSYSQEGDMYNREHSVPQSWFSGSGIKSDIVHVLPTDGYVNNRRSNYPFAEVNNITYQSNNGYSKLGSCKTAGYSGTVFEPNDEIKGDMARIYFYMITRYESGCGSWGHDVFTNDYPGLTKWTLDMMMRWSKQDPVDEVEVARNNAVYEVQGNRNPYVDYPGLEEYTWGTKKEEVFVYDNFEGGGGGSVETVAMPVFSPDAGSYYDQVEVSISCATEDAVIYYTTNGVEPSEQSTRYESPFTLTETATVKAIAVKDGTTSYQASATYTIVTQGGNPAEGGSIMLCDSFFGTQYNGSISASDTQDLTGTQNGVTVVYSLGQGQNRYCNGEQIRLYPNNTLTISVAEGIMTQLEFSFASGTPSTELTADSGTLQDGKWTGSSQQVMVQLGSGKHARLTSVKVTMAEKDPSGIEAPETVFSLAGHRVIYNLRGQRVAHPTHGLYIVDGKKVLIP
jgi:endonuclease I